MAIGILDAHPLPTWLIDKNDFIIVFANKAAITCYGFSSLEFENYNLLNLFPEESRIRFFDKVNSISGIEDINGEYLHCTKHGKIIVTDIYASSVLIDEIEYYQISVVDQTDKKLSLDHLEGEINRYRTFIEQSSEGIFCQELKAPFYIQDSFENFIKHCQKTSYISYCNDAMAQMYGYELAEDMKGILAENILDYSDESNLKNLEYFVLSGFKLSNTETHEKDRYGNSKYFLNNVIGIVENGYLKRIWGTQRDITEKKKIEEKIRLLANLVEETSDLLTAADLDFRAITWNKAAEKIFGLTAEQVIGTTPGSILNIDYHNATRKQVREIIVTQGEWRGELYFKRPIDNKDITLFSNFKLLRNENGEPIGLLIAGTDITERKEAELRLKESESRFKNVADSAPVMIWIADADNHTTYVNKNWEDFTGINVEEFNILGWHTLVHHDDIEMAFKEYYNAFENREVFNQVYRVRHHSGVHHWLLDTCIPRFLEDGTFIGYIGSSVDVTKQKKIEEELRYNATILENVSDIIVSTDFSMKVIGWNKVAEEYYGIPESEAIGKKINHLVQFDYYGTNETEAAIELQKEGIWNGEVSFVDKEGNTRYFLQTVKFVYDDDGKKIGYIALGRNVTDR
ncbi:MAG: PAS domain S-box protein, partial [Flavisolibacter sp.]